MSEARRTPWLAIVASNVAVAAIVAAVVGWPRAPSTAADDHDGGAGATETLTTTQGDVAATSSNVTGTDDQASDAIAAGGEATSAPETVAAGDAADLAAATTPSAPPLAIVTEPKALRVWHNTQMVVRAVAGPDGFDGFVRYVWHFEDGSRPAEGKEAAHIFPESVTDRHVTLEAFRRDGTRLVVSRRLPIERLDVVPIDGEASTVRALPKARGPRFLLVGEGDDESLVRLCDSLEGAGVAAVVAIGQAAMAERVARRTAQLLPGVPVLRLASDVASNADDVLTGAGADVVTGAGLATIPLGEGDALPPPGIGAWVVGDVAVVAVDTRPMVVDEVRLGALRGALKRASAWPSTLLITARPLSALLDDETVADRAYRIYEHALREGVSAVISAASEVAYDARYGGLEAVSVGRLIPRGCARLRGSDACQTGTATLVELGRHGRIRVFHLVAPRFDHWLGNDELPPTVGRYRR